jgi:hypothetical protein
LHFCSTFCRELVNYYIVLQKSIVYLLWHVLHPWLRPVKDVWNVNKLYSILVLAYLRLFLQNCWKVIGQVLAGGKEGECTEVLQSL